MPVLNIKDPETYELAREVAQRRGETLTQAVKTALKERLARERTTQADQDRLVARVLEIAQWISSHPVLDARTPDEIMGYNDIGVWD